MATRLAALLVLACSLMEAQATGNITGSVMDATTRQPIPRALISTTSGLEFTTAEDGSFTIRDVPAGDLHLKRLIPGDYNAGIGDLPTGYAVADVLYGNASTGDRPFHLEGTGLLTVLITSKAGAISGTVRNTDGKPVRKTLFLVPDSFTAQSSLLRTRGSESDANGAFAFRNLIPGQYRLMIMKSTRFDIPFIAAQMTEGQTVEVRPSATSIVTVNLR